MFRAQPHFGLYWGGDDKRLTAVVEVWGGVQPDSHRSQAKTIKPQ